ncbi:hypothetical protein AMAG_00684 [Allomyces macrogynus ATCC 38327]|uniref:Uncharacterized protein n=1 Tax=Allomyces macrogynus (strain ATCC 38327) TaxID=578462 RepID=A0A0L0RX70_ALLM3|nr:hypothetical protein AMAG_00684 [Allomyces macrogynus ATCC 38327]|eukprot:KNE54724.1 hypothetical protein AMAG_00684 [Allomyces macrogynus ATCC 38327]
MRGDAPPPPLPPHALVYEGPGNSSYYRPGGLGSGGHLPPLPPLPGRSRRGGQRHRRRDRGAPPEYVDRYLGEAAMGGPPPPPPMPPMPPMMVMGPPGPPGGPMPNGMDGDWPPPPRSPPHDRDRDRERGGRRRFAGDRYEPGAPAPSSPGGPMMPTPMDPSSTATPDSRLRVLQSPATRRRPATGGQSTGTGAAATPSRSLQSPAREPSVAATTTSQAAALSATPWADAAEADLARARAESQRTLQALWAARGDRDAAVRRTLAARTDRARVAALVALYAALGDAPVGAGAGVASTNGAIVVPAVAATGAGAA